MNISFQSLELKHRDYETNKAYWSRIDDLVEGGERLRNKRYEYLPQRPGEPDAIYLDRMAQFLYTPVLPTTLARYQATLSSANVEILGAESEPWQRFLSNTDGKGGATIRDTVESVLASFQRWGRVWVECDCDYQALRVIHPTEVINYDISEKTGDVLWCVVRTIRAVNQPFTPTAYVAEWRLYNDEIISVYAAPVEVDPLTGELLSLARGPYEVGELEATVPLVDEYEHGLNSLPIVYAECPPELWTCSQALSVAQARLIVENTQLSTLSVAGHIQRTIKPPKHITDSDAFYTTVDRDVALRKWKPLLDNRTVVQAEGFEFNEVEGKSIATVAKHGLERLEKEIVNLVYYSNAAISADKNTIQPESGYAKALDLTELHDRMRRIGRRVLRVIEQALNTIAPALGSPQGSITATGLDDYRQNSASGLVELVERLSQPGLRLSPTALTQLRARASRAIAVGASPETLRQIEQEISDTLRNDQR